MNNIHAIFTNHKILLLYISIASVILLAVLQSRENLYGIFSEENYLAIHLCIEIFMIFFCFAIAIQIWLSSRFHTSSTLLRYGALFLAVGMFELVHTLSYQGMLIFIHDDRTYIESWFYMIARLSLVVGLVTITLAKTEKVSNTRRFASYIASFIFTAIFIGVIYYPEPLLKPLVDGNGVTVLKYNLQVVALALQIVFLLAVLKRFNVTSRRTLYLIVASLHLIVSDLILIQYTNVYDIMSVIGRIYQLMGFMFLFHAIFYISVERPFVALRKINESLKQTQEEVRKNIYYDRNTGLPNERYLQEYVNEHMHEGMSRKSVLVFGIERYDSVKHSLGSKYADHLLVLIAKRLQAYLPYEYVLCKLQEDRFAIFMQRQKNEEYISRLAKRLQEIMEEPFEIDHFSISSSLHIGISIYPKDATAADDLIQYAHFAAYEATKTEDNIAFYTPKMKEIRAMNLMLEQDLKKAITREELFLEYQPQMDLETGEIYSVEALIRWRHPMRGIISPFEFIPVAEESGLIVPIGQWVLEKACVETVKWQVRHKKSLKVAVNLSMGQLYQKDFVQVVQQTLRKTGMLPQDLQLEITESMTMNTKQIIPVLEELKQLGVTIAVDDFGTGYSSLSYLKNFPLDCLKIDRSFIHNISENTSDEALVQMILSMAKHLNLKVVAEGIETLDQLKYLKNHDCDKIQGYYISKPLPFDQLINEFEPLQHFATEQFVLLKSSI